MAYLRRHEGEEFIVAAPRLLGSLVGDELRDPVGEAVWGDTRLLLPHTETGSVPYLHLFTRQLIAPRVTDGSPGATLLLRDLFADVPFALLHLSGEALG